MNIPIHTTSRLTLRGFRPEDIQILHEIVSDPLVIRYFPLADPWPLEVVQRWVEKHWSHWEEHNFGWWAIDYHQTNELLGWCGLGVLDETGETEVLYLLKKSYWGMGLASEAAKYSLDCAFIDLGLDKVIGLTHPDNIASQKVLQKIGLSFDGEAQYFGMNLNKYSINKHAYFSNSEASE